MPNDFLKLDLKKVFVFNGGNFEEIYPHKLRKTDIFKISQNGVLYTTEENPSGIWVSTSDVGKDYTIKARPYQLAKDYIVERWHK